MKATAFPNGAAIVFGGSGGIGQHLAKGFAAAGADVAIVYRSKEDVAEKIASEIEADGPYRAARKHRRGADPRLGRQP